MVVKRENKLFGQEREKLNERRGGGKIRNVCADECVRVLDKNTLCDVSKTYAGFPGCKGLMGSSRCSVSDGYVS